MTVNCEHYQDSHECQHCLEISDLHVLHPEDRLPAGVLPEDVAEQGRAGAQYNFVGVHLLVIARHQSAVKKVTVLSEFAKRWAYIRLEVIPLKTKLIGTHFKIKFSANFYLLCLMQLFFFTARLIRTAQADFQH